jgi:hypothetical protein
MESLRAMSLLGKFAYQVYHRPTSWLAQVRRQGGLREVWLTTRGLRAMRAASRHLTPIAVGAPAPDRPTLAFLTGNRLWFQTAFCLHTFLRHSSARPPVLVVSDGTLHPSQVADLNRLFPGIGIEAESATTARVDRALPAAQHPEFHRLLSAHVLLRKLAFIHPPGSPPRLFLDSDMLFHGRPTALEAWLDRPEIPVFMTDVVNAYGYPLDILSGLAGRSVPERLNTGVSALPAGFLDWTRLDAWLGHLVTGHGSSYYMEQALFALATAGTAYLALDPAAYVVAPTSEVAARSRGVLHHYVNLSKSHYFRHAWRAALVPLRPLSS